MGDAELERRRMTEAEREFYPTHRYDAWDGLEVDLDMDDQLDSPNGDSAFEALGW